MADDSKDLEQGVEDDLDAIVKAAREEDEREFESEEDEVLAKTDKEDERVALQRRLNKLEKSYMSDKEKAKCEAAFSEFWAEASDTEKRLAKFIKLDEGVAAVTSKIEQVRAEAKAIDDEKAEILRKAQEEIEQEKEQAFTVAIPTPLFLQKSRMKELEEVFDQASAQVDSTDRAAVANQQKALLKLASECIKGAEWLKPDF